MANVKPTVIFLAEDHTITNAALLAQLARESLYKPIRSLRLQGPYASRSGDREFDDKSHNIYR